MRCAGAVGLGVFAVRDIPKGTIIWALDALDQRIDPILVETIGAPLESLVHRYAYVSSQGDWILCWDHARFINHSCRANTMSTGWEFDLAIEDVRAGEQITNDYACLNLEEPFDCLCGRSDCRGTIRNEDFETRAAGWDRRIGDAFSRLLGVPQPLWPMLNNPAEVHGAAAFGAGPPSILRHRSLVNPVLSAARVNA